MFNSIQILLFEATIIGSTDLFIINVEILIHIKCKIIWYNFIYLEEDFVRHHSTRRGFAIYFMSIKLSIS